MHWISVDEQLPDIHEDVLLWTVRGQEVRVGWRSDGDDWATWSDELSDVSHWMPLPTPPIHRLN